MTIPMAAFCLLHQDKLAPLRWQGFLFSPRSFFLRLIRKVFGRSLDTMDHPVFFPVSRGKTVIIIAEEKFKRFVSFHSIHSSRRIPLQKERKKENRPKNPRERYNREI